MYVHVFGTPEWEVIDGAGSGPLQYRPDHYVPVKVPIFDEVTTRRLRNSAAYTGQSADSVAPVYQWPYRPEMQFSVLEFAVQGLQVQDNNGQTQFIDLSSIGPQSFADTLLDPNVLHADLLYDLLSPSFSPLEPFGPERELVFSLGAEEVKATFAEDGTVRFDQIQHLASLDPEDYFTLRFYQNSDAENVLWEYRFAGLRVTTPLPHDDFYVAPEYDPGSTEARYRSVGGMRLNYEYVLPGGAEPVKFSWKFSVNGRYCRQAGVDTTSPNCTAKDADTVWEGRNYHSIYWEPSAWTAPQDITATLTAIYKLNGAEQPPDTQTFHVVSRVLKPDNPPMEGSDVAMLEQMLWQLGLSPQYGFPGRTAARLGEHSNSLGGPVGGIAGIEGRKHFSLDSTRAKGSGSLEKMVKRFQGRHVSAKATAEVNAGKGQDGKVGPITLGHLKNRWSEYYVAYQSYAGITPIGNNYSNMATWLTGATSIWENGLNADVPATYTQTLHEAMLASAGLAANWKTREDLLKAWAVNETYGHWGVSLPGVTQTPYRMMEGADELGSMSFNQVRFAYRYSNRPCKVHADSKLNFYEPSENLKGFAVHTSAKGVTETSAHVSCPGAFYQAYVATGANNLAKPHGAEAPLGYRHNSGEAWKPIVASAKDDAYELLAKAIATYNTAVTAKSWPMLLKTTEKSTHTKNTGKKCYSCGYSIKIRNKSYGLPYRTYVWKGGETKDVNGNPVPWCFAYGEKEWRDGKKWENIWKAGDKYVNGVSVSGTGDPRVDCPV